MALSQNDTIERIEAERMPHLAMDVTPQQVNATGIYAADNLPQAFTGAGVVAGVLDCYYDFTHPAFQDANGDLRVKYYYDFHWPNSDGLLGHALETAAEIAAHEHSRNTRNHIHGTHVMGVMAGSAVNGQLQGMAPETDIYAVDFNSDREEFEGQAGPTSATAVLGFKYIFDKAEQENKPCVINFSSCEAVTLTSQRTLEGEALQALVGPGRIIVSASGNYGKNKCYMEKGASDYQAGTGINNLTNIEGVSQYSFAQPGHSVSWPANLPNIIAVGATGYKNTFTNIAGQTNTFMIDNDFASTQPGCITKFSSCGPTFDGRVKPDVVAPGSNINAAYNSFYDNTNFNDFLTSTLQHNGKTYHYLAQSGTSMASPVVAGVIALWLQAKPDLTPAEALEAIRETSTHPDISLEYPNNSYGYGQIDAYRGLLYVMDLPSRIPELSLEQPKGVKFRVENRTLYVDFGEENPKKVVVNIYSLDGRLLLSHNNSNQVNLSTLKTGVYAVQVITDSRKTTGSTLIRL